jgi:hypothetical protein
MTSQLGARGIEKQRAQASVIAFSKWQSPQSIAMNLSDELLDFTTLYSPFRTGILRSVMNSALEYREKYKT